MRHLQVRLYDAHRPDDHDVFQVDVKCNRFGKTHGLGAIGQKERRAGEHRNLHLGYADSISKLLPGNNGIRSQYWPDHFPPTLLSGHGDQ